MALSPNRITNGWCHPLKREVASFESFNVDGDKPLTEDEVSRFSLDTKIHTVANGVIWKESIVAVQPDGTKPERVYAVKQTKDCQLEATIMANLNHPNIIKPEAVWRANDSWCFAMPYYSLDGDDLLGTKAVELGQALYILKELAQALKYLHSVRVVHADIKPGNILLSDTFDSDVRPDIKLCDFGIARPTGELVGGEMQGNAVGTPEYMSPERWQGKIPDERDDIYGAGCVAYELLGGMLAMQISPSPLVDAVENRVDMSHFSDAGEDIQILLAKMVDRRGPFYNGGALVHYLDKHFPAAP